MSFAEAAVPNNASSAVITKDSTGVIPSGLLIDPVNLFFGSLVADGDTLMRTFNVKNIGRKTLRIESVVLDSGPQFTLDGEFPDLLRPNESFDMSVTYASNTPGLAGGMIVITTSEDRSPYYMGLSGRVIGSLYLEQIFDSFRALVDQESWARATADEAEAGNRLLLQATLGEEITAKILEEQIARVTQYEAVASTVESMEARFGDNEAAITDERLIRIQEDEALASRIQALEADFDNGDEVARASIEQEAIARANADTAEALQRTQLAASINSTINARFTDERAAWVAGDAAEASSRTALETALKLDATTKVNAAISTEQTARANADAANAQSITNLAATVTNQGTNLSASIQTVSQAQATTEGKLTAKYGLVVTAGKRVASMVALATGAGSSLDFTADAIGFSINDGVAAKKLMTLGTRNGSPALVLNGDLYADGSINANALNIGAGGNLLKNSTFLNAASWQFAQNQSVHDSGVNLAGDGWHPSGTNTLTIHQNNANSDAFAIYVSEDIGGIVPGQRYEVSSFMAAHRCNVYIYLEFWDRNNNQLNAAVSAGNTAYSGGRSLGDFARLSAFGSAPAGAAYARMVLAKNGTTSGGDSWLMAACPYVGVAALAQDTPTPYAPSGQGVRITPDLISAPNLAAINADLGHVTAAELDIGGGYARSAGKTWSDGGSGWILGRSPDGTNYMDFQSGQYRIWISSWGDCGIQFPGFSVIGGVLSVSQLNVINTPNIVPNAVTTLAAAYTAGAVSTGNTQITAQQVSVDMGSVNGAVSVRVNSGLQFSASGVYTVTRNGSVIITETISGGASFQLVLDIVDNPGPGNHTYALNIYALSAGNVTAVRRGIAATGCKR